MTRRVVITGMGVCSGVGATTGRFWENLLAGRSGIRLVTLFDASALPVRIGGQVDRNYPDNLAAAFAKAAPGRERKIWLGLDAATQAIHDSGLSASQLRRAILSIGVSLETFFLEDVAPQSGAGSLLQVFKTLAGNGTAAPLQTPLDRLTDILGNHYGIGGDRFTNCSACAAGAQSIGEAFHRVRDGSADLAIAGASDSVLNPLAMGGFSLLQILSRENEIPEEACRPFDATRQGTVLGEGAAFLMLEPLDRAIERGARIYAEILGYGAALDAYRVTDPEPGGQGAALSMRRAIADAGLHPGSIDCINAHGTGTPRNDVAETRAIKAVLGDHAYSIPVTANKSMTGHLIAASGAVEAAVSALTLYSSRVPPTRNLSVRDPECDLDYVAGGARPFTGRTVLSNSFGFGGQNATLVFGKAPSPALAHP